MSFYLISDNGRRTFTIGAADRATFRDNALEIRMHYVPEGETILVTRGQEALLMEGGSGGAVRNPALAQAIARELRGRQVRAIVASHPHFDHTNSYSDLVGAVNFAAGALYFDNGIPRATANFQRINNDHQALPFQRVAVLPNQQQDVTNWIVPNFGGADADIHLLRSSTNAQSPSSQVYWPVFVFLRLRHAWMLFTGDLITKLYQTRIRSRLQTLNPRTHFLQLSHHGNKTGTSQDFVTALRPAIAVASTDDDSGHQLDQEVRDRLSTVDARVLTTFDSERSPGNERKDIVIRTDGLIRADGTGDGVLFEVVYRQPVLGLGT